MRLFINEKVTVLRTSSHIIRLSEGQPAAVLDTSEDPQNRSFNRSGFFVFNGDDGVDYSSVLQGHGALASAAWGRMVVSITADAGGLRLVSGLLPDKPMGSEAGMPLAGIPAPRIEWPRGLIWDSRIEPDQLFAEGEESGDAMTGLPSLSINEFGVGIACKRTGIVALKRHGADRFAMTRRLPTQAEADIFSVPTKRGLLVSFAVSGRETAHIHLMESGAVGGYKQTFASPPAVRVGDGFLVYEQANNHLYLLGDDLVPKSKKRFAFDAVESASSPEGKRFALADDSQIILGHLDADGKLALDEPFGYAEFIRTEKRFRQAAAAASIYEPRRPGGAPAFGLSVSKPMAPWKASLGSDFELLIPIRSTGGGGAGIKVSISGDALKYIDIKTLTIGDKTLPFSALGERSLAVEDKEFKIAEGLVYPFDPQPQNDVQKVAAQGALMDTQTDLRIAGYARLANATALLAVAISAIGSNSHPLKCMRPVHVS